MLYSGIDKHQDNCFIVTVNDQGTVVKEARVANSEVLLTEYFRSFPADEIHRAVVESTAGWYWLDDLLTSLGIELMLAHAKYLKAIAYAKVKTDRVDARTLAHLLRLGYVPEAHKVTRALRELRDLTRARLRLVQRRTACYNSIHRLADKYNCDHRLDMDKAVIPEELPALVREQLHCQAAQIRLLNGQIDHLEQLVEERLVKSDDLVRLVGVPGIGRITGVSLYLEIDGIKRFETEKQFFSYCRVVPGAANSNRTLRHKSGSKDGNVYLKIALSDSAVHAVRLYPEIRRFYQKQLRRHKKAIALTLVAKEIARIVYHILKDKTDYLGFKGQPIERRKHFPVRLHRRAVTRRAVSPGTPG
jgi:transposase